MDGTFGVAKTKGFLKLTASLCESDSARREVMCNILIEFGITLKLVRLIRMCLNETCSRVRVIKLLSDRFSIKEALEKGEALSPLLLNFALEYSIRSVQYPGGLEIKWYTSAFSLCLRYIGWDRAYKKDKHRNFNNR
jgi:hypothetical protein